MDEILVAGHKFLTFKRLLNEEDYRIDFEKHKIFKPEFIMQFKVNEVKGF